MAALPGIMRSRVGYAGGVKDEPSYRKVCRDPDYGDYVETIQLEYDGAQISYSDILDAFFRVHDADRRGKARQYQSVIFVHDADQRDAALNALASRPSAHTKVELAGECFWDAEPYHQKWLLQRKRELFMGLAMEEPAELLEGPATVLNAFAAGRLQSDVAAQRMAFHGVPEDTLKSLFG